MNESKVKSICVPLDPDSCGSTISGYVRFPETRQRKWGKRTWEIDWSAGVSLSDCSRVISWSLDGGSEYDIVKLDRAIYALTILRDHMVEAEKELAPMRDEVKRRNKEIDPADEEDYP